MLFSLYGSDVFHTQEFDKNMDDVHYVGLFNYEQARHFFINNFNSDYFKIFAVNEKEMIIKRITTL